MPRKVRVVVLPVGKPAEVREIDDALEAMQALVGGLIEPLDLDRGPWGAVTVYCNEEGAIHRLPFNRLVRACNGSQHPLRGDLFLARVDEEGDLQSVTDEDIEKYAHTFPMHVPLPTR